MTYATESVHGLSLGDLVFVRDGESVVHTDATSGETYIFEVLDPDTQWGNPKPVTTTLVTLLTNGAQVAHERDDNREPSIALTVKASGPSALAVAETALRRVTAKPAPLAWRPPFAGSAVTVFDVVWSQLDHKMDSVRERWLHRSYKLDMQALPHARSTTKTITPAATTEAPIVIDSGLSATNWSTNASAGAVVSVASGAVRSTYDPSVAMGDFFGTVLRRTATIDVSVWKYIAIDWASSKPSAYGLQTDAAYGNMPEVRREPADSLTRSWFQVPDDVTTLGWLQLVIIHPAYPTGSATLDIGQVLLANQLPASGTARQKTATILPGGSVPASGDLHLVHSSAALGQTIVFTHPILNGYSPPLRPWLFSSDPVHDHPLTVSGSYNAVLSISQFRVPITAIPRGEHHLWVRMAAGTAGTYRVYWAAQSVMGSSVVGETQAGSALLTFPTADTWHIFCLAQMVLPPTDIGVAGMVNIFIQAAETGLSLDEAWTFAMDEGRLTVVDCGTGSPAAGGSGNRLWLKAPSLEQPNGGIYIGTNADESDRYWPSTVAVDQRHQLQPDGSMAFYVTSEVFDAELEFQHYRHWHTHAVD